MEDQVMGMKGSFEIANASMVIIKTNQCNIRVLEVQ